MDQTTTPQRSFNRNRFVKLLNTIVIVITVWGWIMVIITNFGNTYADKTTECFSNLPANTAYDWGAKIDYCLILQKSEEDAIKQMITTGFLIPGVYFIGKKLLGYLFPVTELKKNND
ncbi:hypothetical protein CO180_03515 [candidate division WWE3 bacterium CG_4_9_14_3_um_filter_41_6]|uniref:Uncharacterized protein n=1 Tax=candidate division WWE3 bacterium CG_4_10_14_0_2_um_filter_41_14 TaxID=1975072 RepID=A0A2M7TKG5_UNCKA|nr:MAG: hypothetical protein COY32_02775 [candidate division WWE3 bacterium CG_4_10_14_0_2_um_filter_41_14]PJA38461.1 MAG: hypothetical protein CO180_03515 [candidate division WWE3 bacterium CG_4_9_14_3_um_filter_41_6]